MDWSSVWNELAALCIRYAGKIVGALIVLAVGSALIRWLLKHMPKWLRLHKLDETVANFIRSMVRILLYAVLLISIISILGVPLSSILAVAVSAGAAVALALQGALSNFASGLMLLIFKPLEIGHYIEVDSVSGTVIDVGLFYTILCTPDNKHITLPNSSLTGKTIINYSKEKTRRVDLAFSVAYRTDVEKTKTLIQNHIQQDPRILTDPEPFVRMTEAADSSLILTVRVWCESSLYWPIKFDLQEQIKELFDKEGVEIPFPQLDVHVKQ